MSTTFRRVFNTIKTGLAVVGTLSVGTGYVAIKAIRRPEQVARAPFPPVSLALGAVHSTVLSLGSRACRLNSFWTWIWKTLSSSKGLLLFLCSRYEAVSF